MQGEVVFILWLLSTIVTATELQITLHILTYKVKLAPMYLTFHIKFCRRCLVTDFDCVVTNIFQFGLMYEEFVAAPINLDLKSCIHWQIWSIFIPLQLSVWLWNLTLEGHVLKLLALYILQWDNERDLFFCRTYI